MKCVQLALLTAAVLLAGCNQKPSSSPAARSNDEPDAALTAAIDKGLKKASIPCAFVGI